MAITKIELLDECERYLGSPEKADTCLKTSFLALGNQTPLSLMATDEGIEQVYNCIIRMQHGMLVKKMETFALYA